MSLQSAIAKRGITEVLHFTTNRGLIGSLASQSLLSRPLLGEDAYLRHVLQLNSAVRPEESALFDKTEDWLRYVNLSISEINRRFLDVSRRWHTNHDVWWCILSFDPVIMTHDGVWFATTNNSYDQCQRGQAEDGFGALFAPSIRRKKLGNYGNPWNVQRFGREASLPTCEQAEVLYPESLSLEHLTTVYVEQDEHHDIAVGWLQDFGYSSVNVSIQPQKFIGRQN
ncbi:DarT ssDNA thymidine ADP-ribosyltransferase family protein [Nisaea sp.]|uniref:DarT ssDNA thymidine ADP-ribosyltransferase family protein n=1 Tax=Nisaea sp. TaxID=2024842 RepID=UPI0032EB9D1B